MSGRAAGGQLAHRLGFTSDGRLDACAMNQTRRRYRLNGRPAFAFTPESRRLGPRAQAPASDDEEERRARLLLLGKAAVLAHRFERPLAAEMDDDQQS
jgi:hypothetical protein